MMRFYNHPHRFYCGVDLHARTMCLCACVPVYLQQPREVKRGHPCLFWLDFFRHPWPTTRTQRRLHTQTCGHRLLPPLTPKRPATLDAHSKLVEFGFRHRLIHVIDPGRASSHGAFVPIGRSLQRPLPADHARPGPIFRPLHQAGPQRISFDVTQHRQQMLVVFDRKCLESAPCQMWPLDR